MEDMHGRVGSFEKLMLVAATVMQVGALLYVPLFMSATNNDVGAEVRIRFRIVG